MKRILSIKSEGRASTPLDGRAMSEIGDDKSSLADTAVVNTGPLVPPSLKVNKLDYYYSRWSRGWKYKKMGSTAVAEFVKAGPRKGSSDDAWAQFCFVVVRTIGQKDKKDIYKVVVKSDYLLRALRDVIGDVPSISWILEPLELDPKLLLSFLPQFEKYRDGLKAQPKDKSLEDYYVFQTIEVLIDYLRTDYRATITSFEKLIAHGEISSELLPVLFVPRSIVVTTCPMTGEPRASRIVSVSSRLMNTGMACELVLAGIDVIDDGALSSGDFTDCQSNFCIYPFAGAKKINQLEAYPIEYNRHPKALRDKLIERGRKWASLDGIHHMSYKGVGGVKDNIKFIKYNLNSRVIIDRDNFRRLMPNYILPTKVTPPPPTPQRQPGMPVPPPGMYYDDMGQLVPVAPLVLPVHAADGRKEKRSLTEDELMLTPPVLYGFSLSDKLWLELNVEKLSPVEWNTEAFNNLVLPDDKKMLLQSLIEAHNEDLGFDDFVRGKGQGLVVNLFGPPGVGKTLSAEATGELVKRPLYIVGAGDLGITAAELDKQLTQAFELATAWKAIVLIDEADVFLEKRSLHDLKRNAMVSVFLRHLEYYRGILFLTTNRIQSYDDAFLSRIHIALRLHDLPFEAKVKVWTAFLNKLGIQVGQPGAIISADEVKALAAREVNGREIKNAVRTANSLAFARKEKLGFAHLNEVLEVMEHFAIEFDAAQGKDAN